MAHEELGIETIGVKSIGDFKIITNVVDNGKGGNWIVYLHGLPGGPIGELKDHLSLFTKHGFSSISFNYPGLWQSQGKFNMEDISKVLKSTFSYLDKFDPEKTFLFGESFGGLVAFNSVAYNLYKIDKVVLRSPLTDIKPVLFFLPGTLEYLEMAGILHSDPNLALKDIEKINPPGLFHKTKHVQFWGVIGKNDEILPAQDMVAVTEGYENIRLELWDDFPHHTISRESLNLFLKNHWYFSSRKP
jgi:pimeloyl-ACP methyl ester carboxylesterase